MNNRNKRLAVLFMVLMAPLSMAVQVNQKGLGEVLIYPYYTVNNDLNTLYSVVNTTPDTKALAVRFMEGDNGMEVLNFNIYLSAYDVWTGVLVPSVSTQNDHNGEPSVVHITSDTSCAPFLNKANQEFLPFVIDTDIDADNQSLERSREGYIEIIELATFNGRTVALADHGTSGVPANCAAIAADWADDDSYNTHADEQAPTAGLLGSATVVNVYEGLAFSYDAIALQNFWQGVGMHTEPGSLEPDLSDAFPESRVLLDTGELAVSEWSTGYEAVSAVLMNTYVYNEYALDTIVNGKSEWVVTFPTKKYHTINSSAVRAPFSRRWNGRTSCDNYDMDIYDREEQIDQLITCNVTCPPPGSGPEICYTSNVLEFLLPGIPERLKSEVLGSNNHLSLTTPSAQFATEGGWASLSFREEQHRMNPLSGVAYFGLPVTGFAVQQFTNAGAGPGLLAQYGGLYKHKGVVVTDEELVD